MTDAVSHEHALVIVPGYDIGTPSSLKMRDTNDMTKHKIHSDIISYD